MLSHYYADSNSPFDDALNDFEARGAEALADYSMTALDGFRSVAQNLLDAPCYSGEPRLIGFEAALDVAIDIKSVVEAGEEF